MITPDDIVKKAERKVPEVLSAWLENRNYFPMILRCDKTLTEDSYEVLHKELGLLLESSKDLKGYGYRVELKERNTKRLGRQKLPENIIFDEAQDFWKYIGQEKQWIGFQQDTALIRKELPQLGDWLAGNPLKVITSAGNWTGLLDVCKYFIANPQPGCYLREIPAQPHTKFIEENMAILDNLLTVLIGDFICKDGGCFEERFHIKTYERLLQVRFLDQNLAKYFCGVAHIGITIPDLARLDLPFTRVIIMENKATYSNIENFLTLPQLTNTIAIFGSGASVSVLKQIAWLKEKEILYWGDIDVQGFEMLSTIRGTFQQINAILMDKAVFNAFSTQLTTGPTSKINHINHLNKEEEDFYYYLKGLTKNNRLEQERIPNWYVIKQLSEILDRE